MLSFNSALLAVALLAGNPHTTVSSAPIEPRAQPFDKPLGGINLAGFDFGVDIWGDSNGPYVAPPMWHIDHFGAQGARLFRLPFAWQFMQNDHWNWGSINDGFFNQYNAYVNKITSMGGYAIVDLHNYARLDGKLVGQADGPSNDKFSDFWGKLASKLKDNNNVIFGIMNEPHDLDLDKWAITVQQAITAIRNAGARNQMILIPGSHFSAASTFNVTYPALKNVHDIDGSNNKIIFDVHAYLDSDHSGTNRDCVTANIDVFQQVQQILQANNRQAMLTETGGGQTDSCIKYLKEQMDYISQFPNQFIGWCGWSAGAFDPNYVLSLTPTQNDDGHDNQIWFQAFRSHL